MNETPAEQCMRTIKIVKQNMCFCAWDTVSITRKEQMNPSHKCTLTIVSQNVYFHVSKCACSGICKSFELIALILGRLLEA